MKRLGRLGIREAVGDLADAIGVVLDEFAGAGVRHQVALDGAFRPAMGEWIVMKAAPSAGGELGRLRKKSGGARGGPKREHPADCVEHQEILLTAPSLFAISPLTSNQARSTRITSPTFSVLLCRSSNETRRRT